MSPENEHIVRKSITVDAEPATVWDALTNPEKTKKYFFGCRVYSEWREGSEIAFRGRMFFIFKIELTGKIVQIQPEKLLQYTLKNRKSATHSTVTDRLTYENGKTVLSITDDVGEGEGAEKRYKRSLKGWDRILTGLKKLVEGG
jgi:uncharacterized protein YndB with AHSA1/START domain